VQHALPVLLEKSAPSRDAILCRVRTNYGKLRRRASGTAVTPLFVEGGWTAIVRLPAVRSEEAWVLAFLEQAAVLVQPGWFYDLPGEPFIVLSLLTQEAEFEEGIARIVQYVENG
jgi:alanine-synthesizing transaminase